MTGTSETNRVTVIGLGNMGSALAEALLANGHDVTVWNRTAAKCAAAVTAGARPAATCGEAIGAAETIVVCLSDHQASQSLLHDEAVTLALQGKLLVRLSTVTADESRDTATWAARYDIAYLDGSILAYPAGIRSNEGTIVYSGPKALFDAKQASLAGLGGRPLHVGEEVGGAPTFDKAIYANHYGSMLAFFHGAALCHEAGLSLESYIDLATAAGPAQKIAFGEMIAKRDYDNPGCALTIEAAAYDHVVKLSEALGIDGALAAVVAGTFERAIAAGHGDQALAATFEVLTQQRA